MFVFDCVCILKFIFHVFILLTPRHPHNHSYFGYIFHSFQACSSLFFLFSRRRSPSSALRSSSCLYRSSPATQGCCCAWLVRSAAAAFTPAAFSSIHRTSHRNTGALSLVSPKPRLAFDFDISGDKGMLIRVENFLSAMLFFCSGFDLSTNLILKRSGHEGQDGCRVIGTRPAFFSIDSGPRNWFESLRVTLCGPETVLM